MRYSRNLYDLMVPSMVPVDLTAFTEATNSMLKTSLLAITQTGKSLIIDGMPFFLEIDEVPLGCI